LFSELPEPDAELGELGCRQPANSKTRVAVAMPNLMARTDFIVTPYGGYPGPRGDVHEAFANARHGGRTDGNQGVSCHRAAEAAEATTFRCVIAGLLFVTWRSECYVPSQRTCELH